MLKCQNINIKECQHVNIPKCWNVEMLKCRWIDQSGYQPVSAGLASKGPQDATVLIPGLNPT